MPNCETDPARHARAHVRSTLHDEDAACAIYVLRFDNELHVFCCCASMLHVDGLCLLVGVLRVWMYMTDPTLLWWGDERYRSGAWERRWDKLKEKPWCKGEQQNQGQEIIIDVGNATFSFNDANFEGKNGRQTGKWRIYVSRVQIQMSGRKVSTLLKWKTGESRNEERERGNNLSLQKFVGVKIRGNWNLLHSHTMKQQIQYFWTRAEGYNNYYYRMKSCM